MHAMTRTLVVLVLLCTAVPALSSVPSPANSTFPSCIVTCPRGDIPTSVVIRDAANVPCPGVSVAMFVNPPCITGPCFTGPVFFVATTNNAGVATFNPGMGGCCIQGNVQFFDNTTGVLLGTVGPPGQRSPDIDGNCRVDLADVQLFVAAFNTGQARCEDYNCDGVLNLQDISVIAQHFGH